MKSPHNVLNMVTSLYAVRSPSLLLVIRFTINKVWSQFEITALRVESIMAFLLVQNRRIPGSACWNYKQDLCRLRKPEACSWLDVLSWSQTLAAGPVRKWVELPSAYPVISPIRFDPTVAIGRYGLPLIHHPVRLWIFDWLHPLVVGLLSRTMWSNRYRDLRLLALILILVSVASWRTKTDMYLGFLAAASSATYLTPI